MARRDPGCGLSAQRSIEDAIFAHHVLRHLRNWDDHKAFCPATQARQARTSSRHS